MPRLAHIASVALACFVVFVPVAAPTLGAQRRPATDVSAKSPANTAAVRAELAAVLLQSKKYDDAVREYRALLAA